MFGRKIFREKSLQQLSSPEQLDQLMQITQPRSWIALLGLCALLVLFIGWAVFGRIPIEITAPSVFLKSGGINQIAATHDGQVSTLYVKVGDLVTAGQPVADLRTVDATIPITSPFAGQILSLDTALGTPLQIGDVIAKLEAVGDTVQQEAILYLPAAKTQQLEVGQRVYLEPAALPDTTVGAFIGEVAAIGTYPVSRERVQQQLGSAETVTALNLPTNALEVRVRLLKSATGYAWSATPAPDFTPISGTLARARIVIGEQQPLGFVLPMRPASE